jgi:predicted TIM-barrel fold metal-dependent hydrolase
MVKGYFVIDMQHHYIPPDALQFAGKTSEYDFSTSLTRFKKAYGVMTDIEADVAFMDIAGIDAAVLSTGSFTPNGYKFCHECNSGYSKAVRRFPDRFKGLIHVYPLDDTARNRDEIKRGVEELGLFGLALVSSYGAITPDSPVMDYLYESAIAYDMPVYIHPTIRTTLWGGDRYDMYTTVSREYDIVKSYVETLFGVVPRFPELKVIIAHFGGGLPTLKGRLLAWHQPEHLPIPPESRRQGLSIEEAKELGAYDDFESRGKNFIFDSAGLGGWLPVIRSAFETLGADHICFGSDYPYELNKPVYTNRAIQLMTGIDTSREDKEKFFGGNLKKVFGF